MTNRLLSLALLLCSMTAAPAWAATSCATLSPAEARGGTGGPKPWAKVPTVTATSPAALARLPRPAIVRNAALKGADLSGIDLGGLCFQGGDLSGTRWRKAEGVALIETDLTGADLTGASMKVGSPGTELEFAL